MPGEPEWLIWTRELQALAQTGLAFSVNPYDRERYETLRALASTMMAAQTSAQAERIEALFANETGYATPKIDVRGAAFDERDRILMVREAADAGRWTLPGGFADVNMTVTESVVKEVREESGFEVQVRKLAAVWDRTRRVSVLDSRDSLDSKRLASGRRLTAGWARPSVRHAHPHRTDRKRSPSAQPRDGDAGLR